VTIKEILDYSIKNKMVDLQALIIFLTLEKKVLTLEDDAAELDLYFLPKHRERMNNLIGEFKKKMNMEYEIYIFKVNDEIFISGYDYKHAKTIAFSNGIFVKSIEVVDPNMLMWDGERNISLKDLAKNKAKILK